MILAALNTLQTANGSWKYLFLQLLALTRIIDRYVPEAVEDTSDQLGLAKLNWWDVIVHKSTRSVTHVQSFVTWLSI